MMCPPFGYQKGTIRPWAVRVAVVAVAATVAALVVVGFAWRPVEAQMERKRANPGGPVDDVSHGSLSLATDGWHVTKSCRYNHHL